MVDFSLFAMSLSADPSFAIVTTGGTIDSYFNLARNRVEVNDKSVIAEYLELLNLPYRYEFLPVCMKDSRDLTPDDLHQLCSVLSETDLDHILLLHGTYTMSQTAQLLERQKDLVAKTIILTGSMVPLKGFSLSDASFNLGFAIGGFQYLDAGVHVAMNGQFFAPSNVRKNVEEGRFESVSDQSSRYDPQNPHFDELRKNTRWSHSLAQKERSVAPQD